MKSRCFQCKTVYQLTAVITFVDNHGTKQVHRRMVIQSQQTQLRFGWHWNPTEVIAIWRWLPHGTDEDHEVLGRYEVYVFSNVIPHRYRLTLWHFCHRYAAFHICENKLLAASCIVELQKLTYLRVSRQGKHRGCRSNFVSIGNTKVEMWITLVIVFSLDFCKENKHRFHVSLQRSERSQVIVCHREVIYEQNRQVSRLKLYW